MSSLIPDIETKSLNEIQQFQEKKLVQLLSYVNTYSKFYQSRFKENGIDISKINTLPEFVEASREYHKWFDSGH